jgi:hypothetical protein
MRGRVRWRRCWSSRRRAVLEHGPEGPVVKAMHGTNLGRFSPIDQKESAVQEPDDRCACGDPAVCATVDGLRCRGCAVRHDLLDHPETAPVLTAVQTTRRPTNLVLSGGCREATPADRPPAGREAGSLLTRLEHDPRLEVNREVGR